MSHCPKSLEDPLALNGKKNLISANLAMGKIQKKSYFVTRIECLNVCIRNERGTKVSNTFVSTSFGPLMASVEVQLWNLFLSLIGIFQFHRYLLIPTDMFNQMLHELVSLFLQ